MKCPKDVKPEHYDEMQRYTPKGAVLYSHKKSGMWRDFTFLVEGPTSKEFCMKQGDKFVISLPRI